jgi:F-type H+-transporting ATPase subunit delta
LRAKSTTQQGIAARFYMSLSYSEQKQIAQRYARAAFEIAQEGKAAESTLQALQALAASIEDAPALKRAIASPLADADALSAALLALMQKHKMPKPAQQLIALLCRNGRLGQLSYVADSFQALQDAANGVTRATLTSAAPIDAAQLENIAKALSSKTRMVTLQAKEDAALLGGVTLQMGSQFIDASVAGKLRQMRGALLQPITSPHFDS